MSGFNTVHSLKATSFSSALATLLLGGFQTLARDSSLISFSTPLRFHQQIEDYTNLGIVSEVVIIILCLSHEFS